MMMSLFDTPRYPARVREPGDVVVAWPPTARTDNVGYFFEFAKNVERHHDWI